MDALNQQHHLGPMDRPRVPRRVALDAEAQGLVWPGTLGLRAKRRLDKELEAANARQGTRQDPLQGSGKIQRLDDPMAPAGTARLGQQPLQLQSVTGRSQALLPPPPSPAPQQQTLVAAVEHLTMITVDARGGSQQQPLAAAGGVQVVFEGPGQVQAAGAAPHQEQPLPRPLPGASAAIAQVAARQMEYSHRRAEVGRSATAC